MIRWVLTVILLFCVACANSDRDQTDTVAAIKGETMIQEPTRIAIESISGDTTTLADLGGKALLIVNVASRCGNTPQYADLEELYKTYKDRGLVVVGFPSNQFGGQEPGSDQEILTFCQTEYGVTFPMMSKIDVKGPGQHPLYRYLTRQPGREGDIQWNFAKFLLNAEGKVVARFEPQVTPASPQVIAAVEALI